ncbi:PRC-barrel domain-containing protein [Vreelandella salicampi]|uniref:PRC-barrel domain-containing protein n=1 Tax=Vreelandella salicampi TaxID=1449798 RepID=A0A7Z0RTF6_9GAMM|nr:PRC-barrel domain-containing protein [Halomonas salicampi]NYS59393.1 PRC-barrel domain-containing protein [Halomonas salicampi]
MTKLTKLILSAAITPAFAFCTAAIAENQNDMQSEQSKDATQQSDGSPTTIDYDEYRVGEKKIILPKVSEQPAGKSTSNGKPSSAFFAADVIGNHVNHRNSDENIGEIKDLIIGTDGRVVGVVVLTSGFLVDGGQEAGLAWDQINHSMEDGESVFYTEIDEEALRKTLKYVRD